ncbi:MAG TPA: glycosyltransferase family 39 protein [Bacteroidales bacterium]|nr:glycosyltransferase family 39 protein [Bacteroidales bacterium]
MGLFVTYFSPIQLGLLIAAGLGLAASVTAELRQRPGLSTLLLVLTALLLYSFAALLDPFLNIWDERFHALVAKNLLAHPLKPTLYDDPVLDMAYDNWTIYHVWLHKPPLFLWQIALSFKLFGISEFSLRIPNILMGALLVPVSMRTAQRLTDRMTAYLSGLMVLTTVYFLEMVGGRQDMDHNDVAFLFYISLSIWSWTEYHHSGKRRWALAAGAFAGLAILCKWLPGLLVYLGWGAFLLMSRRFSLKENADLLRALGLTVLVALPWQVFSFWAYPEESVAALQANARHFTEPMDGQSGPWWFHFARFPLIYGKWSVYFIGPALFLLWYRASDRRLALAWLVMIAGVYLFFSLAVTKMGSFTVILLLPVSIALAALFREGLTQVERWGGRRLRALVLPLGVIALVALRVDVEALQARHTLWQPDNQYTRMLMHNREVFRSLDLPPDAVLCNVKGRHYIEAMFYTGLPAYGLIPDEAQLRDLEAKGRRVALFAVQGEELPLWISRDTTVIMIQEQLQGYE